MSLGLERTCPECGRMSGSGLKHWQGCSRYDAGRDQLRADELEARIRELERACQTALKELDGYFGPPGAYGLGGWDLHRARVALANALRESGS